MPHSLESQAAEFRALALRLKELGEKGLRRELTNAIRDAVKPLKAEILDPEHLKPYMPDHYVPALLSNLKVTTFSRAGLDAGVSIRAEARTPRGSYRQVVQLEEGRIRHPVFGDRKNWKTQHGGMRPGFFSDAVRERGPGIRDAVVQAGHDVAQKITRG